MNHSQPTGFFPVIAALLGNICITTMKIVGFVLTGSSAMFSEAIHTAADTGNQALLMIGIKRSQRNADKKYQYGFGQERFFWALISACGIFFLGAGVTLYHGFVSLFTHEPVHTNLLGYIILGVSTLIESTTLFFAYYELKKHSIETGVLQIIQSADPTTLAVLYEDGVAVLGSLLAAVSIALSAYTHNAVWDAIGSLLIGGLLLLVAIALIIKNRSYLLDKAMPPALEERAMAILNNEPSIEKVIDFKSTVLDVDVYRIKCEVEFNGSELLKEINNYGELREDFDEVRADYSHFLRFCSELADRAPRLIGTKINQIEKRIIEQIPQVRHIDIEIN